MVTLGTTRLAGLILVKILTVPRDYPIMVRGWIWPRIKLTAGLGPAGFIKPVVAALSKATMTLATGMAGLNLATPRANLGSGRIKCRPGATAMAMTTA